MYDFGSQPNAVPRIEEPYTSFIKPMYFFEHLFAYISLGLLTSWYYVMLLGCPILIYFAFCKSVTAILILLLFATLAYLPINYEPRMNFINSWIFKTWRDYFSMTWENELVMVKGKKYLFLEFPHGIFPLGQLISASAVKYIFPGHVICGVAASATFVFPVMRQLLSWVGIRPAEKVHMKNIFARGHHVAVIPGGIAEMFLVNDKSEEIYLKGRLNTIKLAIEEGADIVPVMFFGNSKILTPLGSGTMLASFLAALSRKLRASIIIYYGRHFLPVPSRHPIHFAIGKPISVVQLENPTDEQAATLLDQVVKAVALLYQEKRPNWETRPLVIN